MNHMTKYKNIHTHGGTIKDISIDMSVNINPLGMPKGCMEAAMKTIR